MNFVLIYQTSENDNHLLSINISKTDQLRLPNKPHRWHSYLSLDIRGKPMDGQQQQSRTARCKHSVTYGGNKRRIEGIICISEEYACLSNSGVSN